MILDSMALKLCDIQGRLFELSVKAGYDSASFIEAFMKSEVAKYLDSTYNRYQWAGEEYLLEEIEDVCASKLFKGGKVYSKDAIYWIGYLYRYWHYYTNESSAKIYKQAPVSVMITNYMMFHTLDPILAIENLKEIYNQKKK